MRVHTSSDGALSVVLRRGDTISKVGLLAATNRLALSLIGKARPEDELTTVDLPRDSALYDTVCSIQVPDAAEVRDGVSTVHADRKVVAVGDVVNNGTGDVCLRIENLIIASDGALAGGLVAGRGAVGDAARAAGTLVGTLGLVIVDAGEWVIEGALAAITMEINRYSEQREEKQITYVLHAAWLSSSPLVHAPPE